MAVIQKIINGNNQREGTVIATVNMLGATEVQLNRARIDSITFAYVDLKYNNKFSNYAPYNPSGVHTSAN